MNRSGTSAPSSSAWPASFVQWWGGLPRVQAPASKYTILAGQEYVVSEPAVNADWYNAYNVDGSAFMDRVDFVGKTKFYVITYNHRMAFVNADDVDVVPAAR